MKGVNKCYGLLLVLATIFGLSLSVSSDTSALKYAYNSFPLYSHLYSTGNYVIKSGSGFSVHFRSSSSMSYDTDLTNLEKNYFKICNGGDNKRSIFSPYFSSNVFMFPSNASFNKYADGFNSTYCGSPALVSYSTDYTFDSIYSASYNLSTGDTLKLVQLNNLIFDQGDSGYDAGSLYLLNIPFTLESNFDSISANTHLAWDFGLVQPRANGFPYVSSDISANLYVSYFTKSKNQDGFSTSKVTNDSSPLSCSINRDFSFFVDNTEERQQYKGLNFHCEFTPDSNIYYLNPYLQITTSDSNGFLQYDYNGVYFSGTFLVTDYDDTWSGQYANPQPSGSNIENTPGFHQLYGYPSQGGCDDGDFICDLSNLFNFNFINPFAPIFQLFSNNESCASIPTLAGMLHSEETEVCPWFDSTTRGVVTPVLGLSSMMLVFGFAVRWLGARSGNFVEDNTDGFDSGGIHVGRRKR